MPDDQLFAYDSAELQPSSITQLQKLGTLIKRNPRATFTVEGYTDSLGAPDYNLELSQRRADSVKEYLVDVMGINPAQIETKGYGASKFLVAPRPVAVNSPEEQIEIERQRPNRRVVIVVHTDAR
jgi:OOP family OmpA-OmpF porin